MQIFTFDVFEILAWMFAVFIVLAGQFIVHKVHNCFVVDGVVIVNSVARHYRIHRVIIARCYKIDLVRICMRINIQQGTYQAQTFEAHVWVSLVDTLYVNAHRDFGIYSMLQKTLFFFLK